ALVGPQHGRQRARGRLANCAACRLPADHDGAAGGFADRPHRRHRRRDADGRLWSWRRHGARLALRRLARRVRRHRRDRRPRVRSRQGDSTGAPPSPALAPGGFAAEYALMYVGMLIASPAFPVWSIAQPLSRSSKPTRSSASKCVQGQEDPIGASCRNAETSCGRTRIGPLSQTVPDWLVATTETGRDHTVPNSEVAHGCAWRPYAVWKVQPVWAPAGS